MSSELRQNQILEILTEQGAVSVRSLTSTLFASEATIRRDLNELEKKGALKRTFGGAESIEETNHQIPLFVREAMNSVSKNKICKQASALVRNGMSIFIDGSSTAQYLVKYLHDFKDLNVVTYSLKTAELLCKSHIRTYCTGGLLMENSLVCTGSDTISYADHLNFDICFLSCKGVNGNGIFSDTSEEETAVRRSFLAHSNTRVLLMTANKIGNTYFHTLCRSTDIDYIFTDGILPPQMALRKGRNN